jgi:gamma-glutamyl hydrolase
LLLPGGGADIDPAKSKLFKAANVIYQEAEKSNKLGRRFPIWGTCLGWELLATLASNYGVLTKSGDFNHQGVSDAIFQLDRSAGMFRTMPPRLFRPLEHKGKLLYFSHHMGVTPEAFEQSLDAKCWRIVAEGQDAQGKAFVAAAESRCRPYYGVQFHPEKSLFEWYSKADIPHSFVANEITRHFIGFLGKQLKQARPIAKDEAWILGNSIHKQGKLINMGDSYFGQIYLFSNASRPKDAPFEDHVRPAFDDFTVSQA